jgi:hypothetical protein
MTGVSVPHDLLRRGAISRITGKRRLLPAVILYRPMILLWLQPLALLHNGMTNNHYQLIICHCGSSGVTWSTSLCYITTFLSHTRGRRSYGLNGQRSRRTVLIVV